MYAIITSSGKRGYHCTAHSPNLDETTIQTLEQMALPFGSAWQLYIGARSIKAFPLQNEQMAISYTGVTDRQDDYGRPGVLISKCLVVNFEQFTYLVSNNPGFRSIQFSIILR